MCCFAPPACMNAARDVRGKSEHRRKWGCSFLRCVFRMAEIQPWHNVQIHPYSSLLCCCTRAVHLVLSVVPFPIPHEQLKMALLTKLAEVALVTCWLNTGEGIGRVGVLADRHPLKPLSPVWGMIPGYAACTTGIWTSVKEFNLSCYRKLILLHDMEDVK